MFSKSGLFKEIPIIIDQLKLAYTWVTPGLRQTAVISVT